MNICGSDGSNGSKNLGFFGVLVPNAGIIKQSIGARNRVGIGLSYRPARLHSLAEFGSLESILRLLKS
jgi:hypothetical protein